MNTKLWYLVIAAALVFLPCCSGGLLGQPIFPPPTVVANAQNDSSTPTGACDPTLPTCCDPTISTCANSCPTCTNWCQSTSAQSCSATVGTGADGFFNKQSCAVAGLKLDCDTDFRPAAIAVQPLTKDGIDDLLYVYTHPGSTLVSFGMAKGIGDYTYVNPRVFDTVFDPSLDIVLVDPAAISAKVNPDGDSTVAVTIHAEDAQGNKFNVAVTASLAALLSTHVGGTVSKRTLNTDFVGNPGTIVSGDGGTLPKGNPVAYAITPDVSTTTLKWGMMNSSGIFVTGFQSVAGLVADPASSGINQPHHMVTLAKSDVFDVLASTSNGVQHYTVNPDGSLSFLGTISLGSSNSTSGATVLRKLQINGADAVVAMDPSANSGYLFSVGGNVTSTKTFSVGSGNWRDFVPYNDGNANPGLAFLSSGSGLQPAEVVTLFYDTLLQNYAPGPVLPLSSTVPTNVVAIEALKSTTSSSENLVVADAGAAPGGGLHIVVRIPAGPPPPIPMGALTKVTLQVSSNHLNPGDSLGLTVVVQDMAGNPVTGQVTINDGGSAIAAGTLDATGKFATSINSLAPGHHYLTATYVTNPTFNGSLSGIVDSYVFATPCATPSSWVVSPTSLNFGSVPISANPSFNSGATLDFTITNAGCVPGSFMVTDTSPYSLHTLFNPTPPPASGTSSISASLDPSATKTIAVQFAPTSDGSFTSTLNIKTSGNTLSVPLTGTGTCPPITVSTNSFGNPSATPPNGTVGQAYAPLGIGVQAFGGTPPYTVSVVGALPPGVVLHPPGPSGFSSSLVVFDGVPTQAGTFTFTITATDANGCPGSQTYTVTVNPEATATTLTSSLGLSLFGESVTFTATVSGAITPTGTVIFFEGLDPIGTGTLRGGTATLTLSTLPTGLHAITAVYQGDSNSTGSTSTAFTQTVLPEPTTTTVTVSDSSPVYGQSITVTATSKGSTPVGMTTFVIDGVAGSPVPLVNGVATFSTSTLSAGTHTIIANYSGSTSFAPSSGTLALTVNKALVTITADNLTKILNALNPPFTWKASGLVNGDTPAVFTSNPTCSTTATINSPVGSDPVTCSGAAAANYIFAYVAGTLKILYSTMIGHMILPPIDPAGTSVFNGGRTLPLKFQAFDANAVSIGTPGVVASFFLTAIINSTTTTVVQDVVDPNTPDAAFRFDPVAQQWILNLSTQNLAAGSTYVFTITLNDGSTIVFQFGLR